MKIFGDQTNIARHIEQLICSFVPWLLFVVAGQIPEGIDQPFECVSCIFFEVGIIRKEKNTRPPRLLHILHGAITYENNIPALTFKYKASDSKLSSKC